MDRVNEARQGAAAGNQQTARFHVQEVKNGAPMAPPTPPMGPPGGPPPTPGAPTGGVVRGNQAWLMNYRAMQQVAPATTPEEAGNALSAAMNMMTQEAAFPFAFDQQALAGAFSEEPQGQPTVPPEAPAPYPGQLYRAQEVPPENADNPIPPGGTALRTRELQAQEEPPPRGGGETPPGGNRISSFFDVFVELSPPGRAQDEPGTAADEPAPGLQIDTEMVQLQLAGQARPFEETNPGGQATQGPPRVQQNPVPPPRGNIGSFFDIFTE